MTFSNWFSYLKTEILLRKFAYVSMLLNCIFMNSKYRSNICDDNLASKSRCVISVMYTPTFNDGLKTIKCLINNIYINYILKYY